MGIAKKKLSREHEEFRTGLPIASTAIESGDGGSALAEKRQKDEEAV